MLTDLSMQNFRAFQSFNVTDWARVNLIVGENSVGKSTLLEAVHLLVNQGYPHVLGTSITSQVLSPNAPLALSFVDWLKRLFNS